MTSIDSGMLTRAARVITTFILSIIISVPATVATLLMAMVRLLLSVWFTVSISFTIRL